MAETQPNQPDPTQPPPPDQTAGPGEEKLPDAEISLDEGEGGETEITETPAAAPAPYVDPDNLSPNKVPANRRIGQLTGRVHALQGNLDAERQRSDALAAENAALKRANADSQYGQAIHYQAALAAKLNESKKAYADALVTNDPDKIADANAAMATIAAEKASIDGYVNQMKARRPQQPQPNGQAQPQPQPQPQPRQQPQLTPETQAWVKDNPWFMPGSDEFDPEMRAFAEASAVQIELRYRRSGRADQIGKKGYFDEITKDMRSNFPEAFGADTAPQPQPMRAGGHVASPSAPGPRANGANGKPPAKLHLTGEERSVARSLTLKYPNGHPKAGMPMTPEDKERSFAREKYGLNKGGVTVTIKATGTKRV